MEIINADTLNEDLMRRSLEIISLFMRAMEYRVNELTKKEPQTSTVIEISSQIIALLATAQYFSCLMPEDTHSELQAKADVLAKYMIKKCNVEQIKFSNTPITNKA